MSWPKSKRAGGRWSNEAERRALARRSAAMAGVPTIPDELHVLFLAGAQEPPPELEAAAAESIRAACRELRRRDPRAKHQPPEDL